MSNEIDADCHYLVGAAVATLAVARLDVTSLAVAKTGVASARQ